MQHASAQLAITEAMPSASTNLGAGLVTQGPDFWEISNFGTNSIDLSGYVFNDSDAIIGGDSESPFGGVIIAPGESIILSRSDTTVVSNRDDFINWWGSNNVPTNLQVLFYAGNGFSATGDSIVLYAPTATNDSDWVDRVDFDIATRGHSFTYNPTNGNFGILSTNGVGGAFKAVTADDEGSPGFTTGPVPLLIVQQPSPTNYTVPSGSDATFTVVAQGLPRAHYQWRNGTNNIDGATKASLTITNAQIADSGSYNVIISNGVTTLTSSNAVLTVSSNAVAPTFTLVPPARLDAFIGQVVNLSASANGSPTPAYHWLRNGTNLAGQTSSTLSLNNVQIADSDTYTVIASNSVSNISASTVLKVTTKPLLVITEVQATEAAPAGAHADWWELTSLDSQTFNLQGYRWDDSSESLAPGNAYTFTNDFTIHPGESIVFVENISADAFRTWWGTNLPPGLQIITYIGGGLGLGAAGDAVNFWNAVSTTNSPRSEKIAGITFANAPSGKTLVYDPDSPYIGGVMSTPATNGINGVFASAVTATNRDIGSPGYVVEPMKVTTSTTNGGFLVNWNSKPNRNYTLYYTDSLTPPNWLPVTNVTAIDTNTITFDPTISTQRFYRVGVTLTVPGL